MAMSQGEESGRFFVEFDAVVSDKRNEGVVNSVFVPKLGRNIEILVPNNIKIGERIWKKTRDARCPVIIFTVKSVSVDPNISSVPLEKKSKKKDAVPKTIKETVKLYRPNAVVRFCDGPAISGIIIIFFTLLVTNLSWYEVMLSLFLAIAIPLVLLKWFYPFHHIKKYIKKKHIDDAIRNDPDGVNIAIVTYNLMPGRRMLRFIKKLNAAAGQEIDRQRSKK